jgi:hypothetical protein
MAVFLFTFAAILFLSATDGFFLSSPTDVPLIPVQCYTGEYVKIDNMFAPSRSGVRLANHRQIRVCAFREDTGTWNGSNYLHRTYMANATADSFSHMARTRCQGFSNNSDLGFGSCRPLPFELYNTTTLCICATDFCNRDLITCQQAVANRTSSQIVSPALFPVLTSPIRCYDNTIVATYFNVYVQRNVSYVCVNPNPVGWYLTPIPTRLIDQTMCEDYAKANAVLCGVGELVTQYYYSSGFGIGNLFWPSPRKIRYTAEDYTHGIVAAFTDATLYYVDSNDGNGFSVTTGFFESSTSVVIRRNVYDAVGNLLHVRSLFCFCTTDDCNSDFETCAAGINYNTTNSPPTGTVPVRTSPSTSSSVAGTCS